jgi:hypothetical protein
MPITINGSTGISGVDGSAAIPALQGSDTNTGIAFGSDVIIGSTGGSERFRVDASGRLLVGTATAASAGDSQYARLQVAGNLSSGTSGAVLSLQRTQAATAITANQLIGEVEFTDSAGNPFANIFCASDAAAGSGDYPGRLVFSVTRDGQSSPTEAYRVLNSGAVYFNTATASESETKGWFLTYGSSSNNSFSGYAYQATVGIISRSNDGELISFRSNATNQGSISVSGTTVSYNGAHLSRWSQLPGGATREEILRGTVLSNIDEMCEWEDEDNEQLNRMKVSDVEGDPNVSGVFQAWDDDDDTYTDDFYCAMTGDFIIRISAGIPVHRGQLLMSAGDGTAKPQGDGFVQDKTVAKVTSNHVTCTYDDGSYCVPCVLMAC